MTSMSLQQRIRERLQQLEAADQLRMPRVVDNDAEGCCQVSGRKLVNFGSNDYLNLSHDSRVCSAFVECGRHQVGSTASTMVTGRSRYHDQLESALAKFEQTEAALLFPSGYAANLGVINGLVEEGDAVFSDRDNHASLIDAARLCPGRLLVYRRDRLEQLEQSLRRRRSQFDQVFLVTDGVFSMDGSVAPLRELCEIAAKLDAHVIVDEAHGTGVLGQHGRGAAELAGVEDQVLLRIGTMSKAMGGLGGFVVSSSHVIDWLRNSARTQFFSTALPPAVCAAMVESLNIIQADPQSRDQLKLLTAHTVQRAEQLGLTVIGTPVAPIIGVRMASENAAIDVSRVLLEHGFFVPAIRPPTVARETSRLRISLNVVQTNDLVERLLTLIAGQM